MPEHPTGTRHPVDPVVTAQRRRGRWLALGAALFGLALLVSMIGLVVA